jgi:hypothetical protein
VLCIGCIFFGGFGSSVLLPRIVKIFADSASAGGSDLLNLIVICGMNKQASAAAMLRARVCECVRACARARVSSASPRRLARADVHSALRTSVERSTRSRGPRREGSPAVAWIPLPRCLAATHALLWVRNGACG